MGSNLWSWQRAQPTVSPSHTVPVVETRSTTLSTKNSSAMMPISEFMRWLRLNPVAIFWSSVAFGSRSPASCSIVKRSNVRFRLKASMTQSRQRDMSRRWSAK